MQGFLKSGRQVQVTANIQAVPAVNDTTATDMCPIDLASER
jgi:hypothetical protein